MMNVLKKIGSGKLREEELEKLLFDTQTFGNVEIGLEEGDGLILTECKFVDLKFEKNEEKSRFALDKRLFSMAEKTSFKTHMLGEIMTQNTSGSDLDLSKFKQAKSFKWKN